MTGLSATVAEPEDLCRFLVPQPARWRAPRRSWWWPTAGAEPDVTMLEPGEYLPWAGHSARHAFPQIYELIKQHKMTLVFVNTRSQAEMIFHALWHINEDSLAIALHHGSLDVAQRRKVEEAMTAGKLRAVVCTSSLDLGIDWGDIDLVINVGAPKGASRLLQRIGRANHRLDEPSRGILVPANRFEVLECERRDRRGRRPRPGHAAAAHRRARRAGAARAGLRLRRAVCCRRALRRGQDRRALCGLARADFDAAVDFVATGGYALKAYERFAKIRQTKDGLWRVANPMVAQRYRMNVGTIVEADMLKVRLVRSRAGGAGRDRADRARRAPARRGRGVFHRDDGAGRHLRVRRRDPEIRGAGRGRGLCLALHRRAIPRCRPTRAASFRSRPISPTACGGSWPTRKQWPHLPEQVREWLRHPAMALAGAAAERSAGRDLPARR